MNFPGLRERNGERRNLRRFLVEKPMIAGGGRMTAVRRQQAVLWILIVVFRASLSNRNASLPDVRAPYHCRSQPVP